ncbi:hypothetical protein [Mycobacterium marinum]|uniref:hypothetical protein n=1 Tax=Mycobacterium marinum TaxID=1781 RepID=UPI0021C4A0BB|nr:hypothetical protein [Mycobacterium marinum]
MADKSMRWLAQQSSQILADQEWLTQPVATVLAACIAVLAASIAYLGVLKTTSTTRHEQRRAEKVELLSDGLIAFQNYTRAILQLGHTTDPQVRAGLVSRLSAGRIDELNDAISLVLGKLALYGFKDIMKEAAPLGAQLATVWQELAAAPTIAIPTTVIENSYKPCVVAFQKAFADLD